jgi:hypothetical protein
MFCSEIKPANKSSKSGVLFVQRFTNEKQIAAIVRASKPTDRASTVFEYVKTKVAKDNVKFDDKYSQLLTDAFKLYHLKTEDNAKIKINDFAPELVTLAQLNYDKFIEDGGKNAFLHDLNESETEYKFDIIENYSSQVWLTYLSIREMMTLRTKWAVTDKVKYNFLKEEEVVDDLNETYADLKDQDHIGIIGTMHSLLLSQSCNNPIYALLWFKLISGKEEFVIKKNESLTDALFHYATKLPSQLNQVFGVNQMNEIYLKTRTDMVLHMEGNTQEASEEEMLQVLIAVEEMILDVNEKDCRSEVIRSILSVDEKRVRDIKQRAVQKSILKRGNVIVTSAIDLIV